MKERIEQEVTWRAL